MNLYIGGGIRLVILPESCDKVSGGYWRKGFYYPKVGYHYGYIKPIKDERKDKNRGK